MNPPPHAEGDQQALRSGRCARPAAAQAWRQLHAAACAPYRASGHFAWHFARGKLGRDPVFRSLVERGDLRGCPRVVDIGCGQGLLASLLQACDDQARRGAAGWPAGWGAPPSAVQYTGIELMPRDVRRAEAALAALPLAPRFVCADMRTAELPPCDLVVILDVLHYVDHAAQLAVLQRARAALGSPGRLITRVGDMAEARAFSASQWVDRVVAGMRGHRVPPVYGRTLADWRALLGTLGFSTQAVPMSGALPFANVLLVADLAGAPA